LKSLRGSDAKKNLTSPEGGQGGAHRGGSMPTLAWAEKEKSRDGEKKSKKVKGDLSESRRIGMREY